MAKSAYVTFAIPTTAAGSTVSHTHQPLPQPLASDFHLLHTFFAAPRQQRMCTCLAWNEMDANILAIGHDRHRSDSCITIWDIDRGLPKETVNFFGLAEAANSLCWDHDHRVLIAGMSQKLIKLFDLRRRLHTFLILLLSFY